jgi:hypothetical protein
MAGATNIDGSAWRRLRIGAALLAIVAVVINGLAPRLHRLALAQAADTVVLCTSEGPVAAHPNGATPSPFAAADCCGLCILGGAALVAASAIASALPAFVARVARPSEPTLTLRLAPTGPPLPARGPPLFS